MSKLYKAMEMDEFITRARAQKLLGCTKETIIELLRSGEIASQRKDNGAWLVSLNSLNAFMKSTWTEDENDPILLQKRIVQLKNGVSYLKSILDENGIDYPDLDKSIIDGFETSSIEEDLSKNDLSLLSLKLPPHALHSLYMRGINTIQQLQALSYLDLMKCSGIGRKTSLLIVKRLEEKGLALRSII